MAFVVNGASTTKAIKSVALYTCVSEGIVGVCSSFVCGIAKTDSIAISCKLEAKASKVAQPKTCRRVGKSL